MSGKKRRRPRKYYKAQIKEAYDVLTQPHDQDDGSEMRQILPDGTITSAFYSWKYVKVKS